MRAVFIGTVKFSLRSLEKLISLNINLVGVVTKESSSFNSDFVDLKPLCISNGIPCLHVDDINSLDSIKWIKDSNPDVIFCFGWSSLIKKEILNIAPMGVVGYHPTKLPMNRGRHPLIWALALGLKESASTFFFMDEGVDSGDILSQLDFEILYQDDACSIYDKVIKIALSQIDEFIPQLKEGNYLRNKQNDQLSNIWRKRNKLDGKIDFRMGSITIYNLVRGLTKPYIGAHIKYEGQDISVWKVKEIENNQKNIEPGKVIEIIGKSFIVKSLNNAVEIMEHDFKTLPKVGEYL
jgi:methionyl-tRNA formyltransferase